MTSTDAATGEQPLPRAAGFGAADDKAVAALLTVLDLQATPEHGDDTFVGPSQPQPIGRVFGGQVLAQSLVAAQRTVDADRRVHSMHAYFLRPGDSNEPINFAVERLRDGRSFSARRTHALQFGRPILSMIASFQLPAEGLEHSVEMPAAPDPESLPTIQQWAARKAPGMTTGWLRDRPFDLRHVEEPIWLSADPQRRAHEAVWLRAAAPIGDDPALHTAMLAYASDYSLIEPILRAHGRYWAEPGLRAASLDHAMWWHRPARADEWLLYVQESPTAQGARGLGLGRLFTRDGVLVASTAQEGMLRVDLGAR